MVCTVSSSKWVLYFFLELYNNVQLGMCYTIFFSSDSSTKFIKMPNARVQQVWSGVACCIHWVAFSHQIWYLIDPHGIRGLMTKRSGKKDGLREYDPIRFFKYQNVWHQRLIPPATLKSTRAASCAETVLGYRVVVLHPDGELLGELSIRNQRLEEPSIKGQHSRRLMQSRAVILTLRTWVTNWGN